MNCLEMICKRCLICLASLRQISRYRLDGLRLMADGGLTLARTFCQYRLIAFSSHPLMIQEVPSENVAVMMLFNPKSIATTLVGNS